MNKSALHLMLALAAAAACPAAVTIDKLAEQGCRFTDAYSTTSVCTPSRYALFTGEYPWRKEGTGILPGDAALIIDTKKPTLPKMLQSHGYKTYMIGKWHLGLGEKGKKIDWNKHISPSPNEIGFDESFIFAATGDRVPCVILENGNVRNLDPNDPIEVSYRHNFPGLPNGKDNKDQLKLMWSHGHNQAIINGIGRIGFMKGGKSALWKDEENADVITDKAIEYIQKSAKAKEPFFLMFATHDIHVPRCPEKRFVGKSRHGVRGDVTVELDDCVRRITEALQQAGLEKDALVIFSSDNGPVLDDGYRDFAVPRRPLPGRQIQHSGRRFPHSVHRQMARRDQPRNHEQSPAQPDGSGSLPGTTAGPRQGQFLP